MTSFAASLIGLAIGWACLVLMVRRNLRQRPQSRKFRNIFITIADDLISKVDLPQAHARQLSVMSSLPEGWFTRIMVVHMFREMLFGTSRKNKDDDSAPRLDQVPPHLRLLYIKAILAFVLGDSYRCAIFGRIIRSTHSWLYEAVKDAKPDVNAHATQVIVERVGQAKAPRRYRAEPELLCAV